MLMLDMSQVKVDLFWSSKINPTVAIRRQVLPFLLMDGKLHVACADINSPNALRAIEQASEYPLTVLAAEPESLKKAIKKIYGNKISTVSVKQDGDETRQLSASILDAAILMQASDIHIDPDKNDLSIRFRIDGKLVEHRTLEMSTFSSLMSRLKVISGMDIAEKRSPQDGYIKYESTLSETTVEMRAATLPTKYGEKMTLRLMSMNAHSVTLEKLGFKSDELSLLERVLDKPHGMILITGPTGSGKSTTLYSGLIKLKKEKPCNIITIEDPVEFDLTGVNQIEIDHQKLTFPSVLKSVLRHDPDVVMVGEMRDRETAEIAIKASMTGHLVLSTLHTNSAPGAITRLIDMGVEPFLVAATVELVVAQRLVRKLCEHCRVEREITAKEAFQLRNSKLEGQSCFDSKGCIYCGGHGYSGRIGLFELLPVNDILARHITDGVTEVDIRSYMKGQGYNTLLEDGSNKITEGITSILEVINACG
jgi:type II secretory ATPase GspE/PulE/Tfp pilus assembly ATPase PilB-like protein